MAASAAHISQHAKIFSTSHIGGSSEEAILAMGRAAIHGLTEYKTASEYAIYQ
jgi:phosphoglycerate dehydrogenase-like enzyme